METGANTAHVIRDRIGPVCDTVEHKARQARRAIVRGKQTAEDFAADAALRVRKHPLGAVTAAIAAGVMAGAMAGGLVGLTAGWLARGRRAA